ncbi:MAG: type II toxin-antitoxin system HicB family antitoxin [Faecalimonas sp.]|nr:type II toxin-antitoxin system HicB family antitoxin [Tyzzerella sp.]MEE0884232.1 type II toxin-antitoxin system HicB family antitoxin [Faecalimonas sp.]
MKLIYPAIFYPYSDGSGGYVVEFPDLPGCVTGGKDLAEALEMAVDAASGWVLDELEEGNPVPRASKYQEVQPKDSGQVNMILLNMDEYAERYGEKAVRKNVTIPAWLNTFAEKQSINFSQVLQEALLVKATKK